MSKFILASVSPRRKEILEKLQIPFETVASDLDEKAEVENDKSPYEWVKAVSEKKGLKALDKITVNEETIIISADTIVTYMGNILHRPKSKDDAREMLKYMQGKKHAVYTCLTLTFVNADGTIEDAESYVDETDVVFSELDDEEIEAYVSTDEPYDKAGGYAIQGKGCMLVDSISGDYYTVVGLPISKLYKALRARGINIYDFWNKKTD